MFVCLFVVVLHLTVSNVQVCQTQYETSCVTKYKETPVVEDVEECNKVYKKSCEYVKSGYGTEKVSEHGCCDTRPSPGVLEQARAGVPHRAQDHLQDPAGHGLRADPL